MSMIPPAAFGPEGTPAFLVHEWSPGVEVVHEVPLGFGAPYYTLVSEYGPGVKLIMLEGDPVPERERQRLLMEQQGHAYAAMLASTTLSFPAAHAGHAAMPVEQVHLLLLR
jgi:hypothetical protein